VGAGSNRFDVGFFFVAVMGPSYACFFRPTYCIQRSCLRASSLRLGHYQPQSSGHFGPLLEEAVFSFARYCDFARTPAQRWRLPGICPTTQRNIAPARPDDRRKQPRKKTIPTQPCPAPAPAAQSRITATPVPWRFGHPVPPRPSPKKPQMKKDNRFREPEYSDLGRRKGL